MDIFESLENLNVSEECFDEIMDMVEELLSGIKEDLQGRYVKTKVSDNLRKDADEYIKHNPEESSYLTLRVNKKYPTKEQSPENNNNKKVSSAKAYELVGGRLSDGTSYDNQYRDTEQMAQREGRSFESVNRRGIPTKQSKRSGYKTDIQNFASSVKRHLRKKNK
jgi:ribosomal protein S13